MTFKNEKMWLIYRVSFGQWWAELGNLGFEFCNTFSGSAVIKNLIIKMLNFQKCYLFEMLKCWMNYNEGKNTKKLVEK
jgi:hypothetical protein